jgi:hypothetical protein
MTLPPDSRTALLHLNALQNLAIKMTEPAGFTSDLLPAGRADSTGGCWRASRDRSRCGWPIFRRSTSPLRRAGSDEVPDLETTDANAERRMERFRSHISQWLAASRPT